MGPYEATGRLLPTVDDGTPDYVNVAHGARRGIAGYFDVTPPGHPIALERGSVPARGESVDLDHDAV